MEKHLNNGYECRKLQIFVSIIQHLSCYASNFSKHLTLTQTHGNDVWLMPYGSMTSEQILDATTNPAISRHVIGVNAGHYSILWYRL